MVMRANAEETKVPMKMMRIGAKLNATMHPILMSPR
jgi:hypothetical protein